jgi:hypothetical protein
MVIRVIKVIIYELPIYVFNNHVNNAIKGHIAGEVINP